MAYVSLLRAAVTDIPELTCDLYSSIYDHMLLTLKNVVTGGRL